MTRQTEMLAGFNVYRTQALVDMLDQPRTFAFVGGLVVDSQAAVVSADPGGVILRVDRAQLAALERTGTVLVESPLHGATYRAAVDDVDRERAFVSLSRFEPFEAYQERRQLGRAVPGLPMVVRVCGHGREASGRIVDLSPTALAADFERAAFARIAKAPVLRIEAWGEEGVPDALFDFVTTAHIRRTVEREDQGVAACRAVLEFESYPALNRALRRYVARRQRELMLELRLAGARPRNGQRTRDPAP